MAEIGKPIRRIRVIPEPVDPTPRPKPEPAPEKKPAKKEPVRTARRVEPHRVPLAARSSENSAEPITRTDLKATDGFGQSTKELFVAS